VSARPRFGLLLFLCFGLTAGCEDLPRFIDPFPILFDSANGPVLMAGSTSEEDAPIPMLLDALSPVTLVDPVALGGSAEVTSQRRITLTLFGIGNAAAATVPRARFPDTAAYQVHPCGVAAGACPVGEEGRTVLIAGLVGADVLSRTATRLDFPTRTLRFFPDIAGDDASQARTCEAVFPGAYAGGGTLRVGQNDVVFGGLRPVVRACLDLAGAPVDVERGVDALLLVSTGMGTSLLAASAYDRYVLATGAPPRDSLPAATLSLVTGPIQVRIGQIGKLALVGQGPGRRGPCRELYANRVMSRDLCNDPTAGITQCPCDNDETFCSTAAAVDLDTPLRVAIIGDEEPLLQGLRNELRPNFPEVDGLLGVEAMAPLRLELDYPNNRLNLRCLATQQCLARPQVVSQSDLPQLAPCLARP
jgi:hypothetical protein